MTGTKQRPEDVPGNAVGTADQQLLKDLREANEKLVLATLRAQELTEQAEAARLRAEQVTEKLKETERELRETAEFREQLLGIVSHDLRNPLGAISMCAQLLLSQGQYDSETIVHKASFLLTSVHRMDRMIKQLFSFTRARLGGGVPLEVEATDLQPICEHTVEELKLTTTVPIHTEYRGDTTGTWDGERLIEALSNLVSNAIDYATEGTPVLVLAQDCGNEIVVRVTNQGKPIPDELLPVLFVAFHRGKAAIKARAGHLGLGLYIAHEIVRSHGGTLTAKSEGGTTTLEMRLPRHSPSEELSAKVRL
jgi:signal transduction histidine kinase